MSFPTVLIAAGTLAALGLGSALPAQASADQEKMIKNREEKLESRFLQKANWILDYDEARKVAKQEGKLIFTYFTRSYAY
jgi:hypothetical protein